MTPALAQLTLILYALMVYAGGFIGFVKAQSRPSLIAGAVSGTILLASVGLSIGLQQHALAFCLGLLVSIVLTAFFTTRYVRSRKLMPAGLMVVLSFITSTLLIMALLNLYPY